MRNRFLIFKPALFLVILVMLFACSGRYKKTSSGLEYKIYTQNKGLKAKEGDYLTMYMIYKTPDDSVIFDSYKDGAPWHFQLMKPPFRGAYEEGLSLLAAGDSATFLVSADSMYAFVFKKSLPQSITPGSKLKFEIKLVNIESPQEAEMTSRKMLGIRTKIEEKAIDQYLKENNLNLNPLPDGLYFIKELKSTGVSPGQGSICVVEYTGKTLDGKVFESSVMDGHPKQVTLGQNSTIKGMEKALLLMNAGERARVIVPFRLGYGEEGKRNPNGTYDVYPYTPLVYELTLRAVKGS